MPVYYYKHRCGMEQEFFLEQSVTTKLIDCYRCGLRVTARQVRDNKQHVGRADGTIGILERGSNNGSTSTRH